MGICELKPIKIDLKNPSYIYDKKCKQNDTLIFNFTVLDDSIAADLTGYSCILNVNKDDKAYEIRDIDIVPTGNKIRIKCPSSVTQIAGNLKLELKFIDTINNLQKTSFDIEIEVKKSVFADANGNVPPVIITQLEHLDESINKIDGTIAKAEQTNITLNNTNNNASSTNTALNNSISNANTAKTNCDTSTGNLNNAVNSANGAIEELKKTNTAYTEHINNLDIHVTKQQKINWDSNTLITQQLLNLVDILIGNTTNLVTENNDNFTTETGDILIV